MFSRDGVMIEKLSEAEVDNFDLAGGTKHNILGFDITMDDAKYMQRV